MDFHHLSEYVHAARRETFGENDVDGSAWADKMMHELKHEGDSIVAHGIIVGSSGLFGRLPRTPNRRPLDAGRDPMLR